MFLIGKKNLTSGFLLVEVIIAISIIIVSVLTSMSVTQKSIFVSRQSLHISQATSLLEEGAEVMRIVRDGSWNNITSLSNGTNYYPVFMTGSWTLSNTPSNIGIFTRKINIASVNRDATTADIAVSGIDDPGTKLVTVTVTWIEGAETLSKTLSFYIMDIFS